MMIDLIWGGHVIVTILPELGVRCFSAELVLK